MAFKGGFLLKPTETGVSALANLYLQGKQAIDKKQREYDAQAQESVAELTEASAFAVTGINQYDNLMSGFGNNIRQRGMALKELYDQRKISLSQLNAGLNSLNSDAKVGSQYANVTKERLADVRKGVESGKYSELNLELPGFFKSKNSGKDVIYSNYRMEYIGNQLSLIRDYEYKNQEGKPQSDSESVPIYAAIDPDRPLYNKIEIDEDIKSFVDRIGKRYTINQYEEAETLSDGKTKRYASVTDPAQFDEIKNRVEDAIDTYGNRDLISIAFDELGFQSTSFSDFDYKRLEKRAKNKKESFLDKNGSIIDFDTDDFILKRNPETGDFYLDDKQEDLVKSYLRAQHLSAFDVVQKEKFVTEEEKPSVGKFYAGSENADTLGDSISKIGSKYGELAFGNAAMRLEDMNTEEAKKLRGISQAIYNVTENNAVSSIYSMNTPDGLNEILADDIELKSFTGQKITGFNQIVSIMQDGKIRFIVMGPSNLADISRKAATGTDVSITTTIGFEEAPSDFLQENTVKRLYTRLLKEEDFRMKAGKLALKESYKTYDEYAEAFNSIIQDYATAE